ncbi:alanine--tRNA ligase [bacterium]|nr:MAG: alanine--tRNA ligase [bacterium]
MDSKELRAKYITFFEEREHKIIPSASLIPENDPTTLFISAGMQPLIPYLLGREHPDVNRLVDIQKCIRTVDIEGVGDSYHHTFFEMIGNWSLGDYFKEDAIKWTLEFFTKSLGMPIERLAVTCFKGNEVSLKDEESEKIWQSLGILENRIAFLEDNWWEGGGAVGPCGPCTEIFYWKPNNEDAPEKFDPEDNNWVEIGNDVLMSHVKENGEYREAGQKNVDFGGGLERVLAVFNGFDDNYLTDLWQPIIKKIEDISGKKYDENKKEMRIIADHIKAAVMILSDDKKIVPSRNDAGYIVRRLIRRAVRYGKMLDVQNSFIPEIAKIIIDMYKDVYEEVDRNKDFVLAELFQEEEKFSKTLNRGLKEFDKYHQDATIYVGGVRTHTDTDKQNRTFGEERKYISGKQAFDLYQSYGFPIEMTVEEARNRKLEVDITGFNQEMEKHRELSRTASAGMFKSGLADHSEETTKLHTSAHLLQSALRKVLGEHVEQRGSNINPERLRFDFSHSDKMTDEQIVEVENIVNKIIEKDLDVIKEEMSPDEAKASGALGLFDSKYGNSVSVYTIQDGDQIVSKEICTGPHVSKTGEIGKFKIKKEQSSSRGIRRIKAVVLLNN